MTIHSFTELLLLQVRVTIHNISLGLISIVKNLDFIYSTSHPSRLRYFDLKKKSLKAALNKANLHFKNGEMYLAEKMFTAILEEYPNNVTAKTGLAKSKEISRSVQFAILRLSKLYKDGDLVATLEQADSLSKVFNNTVEIWKFLGAAAAQLGNLDKAENAFRRITSINPDEASGYYNLANVLKDKQKISEAFETYIQALIKQPDYDLAIKNLILLIEYNDLENYFNHDYAHLSKEIKNILQKVENYFTNKAKNAFANQEFAVAIELYRKSNWLVPDNALLLNNLGICLARLGRSDQAIVAFSNAIRLESDNIAAHNNLGLAFDSAGEFEKAIISYQNALSFDPNFAEAHCNIGLTLSNQGRYREAIESYSKALSIDSGLVEAYSNLGKALQTTGATEKAIQAYREALEIHPENSEIHNNLSFALLNRGRIEDGVIEYEWRFKTEKGKTQIRMFNKPLWNGTDDLSDKTILIWCEQGIGDTLNWASMLDFIASRAKHCILEVQVKIVPLLSRSFPNVEVKTENRAFDIERDDFDVHLPMGSIYKHFKAHNGDRRKTQTYLKPDKNRVAYWKNRLRKLGDGPYIGLGWKSSKITPSRKENYASITEWLPILRIPNVVFINLQYIDYEIDLKTIRSQYGISIYNFDDLDHLNDISDVAALCAALDLVVATKITVPIISAGTGTKTKLAIWRESDWSNDLLNPAGPDVEMFERSTWESWEGAFKKIAKSIIDQTSIK